VTKVHRFIHKELLTLALLQHYPVICEKKIFRLNDYYFDRLCGMVVRISGCRSRDPGFDSRRYQIFCAAVGLERGALSLVRINEELLERKAAAPV
jgi:hypothetical protein